MQLSSFIQGKKKSRCLRALILVHTKCSVYFNNISTCFFYFKYSIFKISYIKLSIFTLYFIKISIFLEFFNCFFFFTYITTTIHSLFSSLRYVKKKKATYEYKMNNVNVNLYDYYNKTCQFIQLYTN